MLEPDLPIAEAAVVARATLIAAAGTLPGISTEVWMVGRTV